MLLIVSTPTVSYTHLVGANNIKEIVEAGATVVVAGSAVFKDNKIEENIKLLKESV